MNDMNKNIRVGITQGDFNGIGPEIIVRTLADESITELFTPVVFADCQIIAEAARTAGVNLPRLNRIQSASEARDGKINIVDLKLDNVSPTPGKPTPESGAASVAALEKAVRAITENDVDVLVTAPISKEAVQSDRFRFPGHTEYLESCAGGECKAQMILFDDSLRVALVTTHLPLAEVPAAISAEKVGEAVKAFAHTLRQDFGIERPKIAVLSLNPHCGDGGLLGHEEQDSIIPAIEACMEAGTLAFGPYAADGFFGTAAYAGFDGVLAMYHDQGLAPFKALARQNGVNFTAGLPFVRTSPDHGTACDIAWTGKADPTSMREAIYKAIDIFRCRKTFKEASANPLIHQTPERNKAERHDRRPAPEKTEHEGKTEHDERPSRRGNEPISQESE